MYTSIILSFVLLGLSFYQLSTKIETEEMYIVNVTGSVQIDDNTSFIGLIDNQKVIVYDKELQYIKPGDILVIKGRLEEPVKNTIPHTFDYEKYLLSQNIKYILYSEELEVKDHRFHIGILAFRIEEYINTYMPYSGYYVKTFILADKDGFSYEFKEELSNLGISHLFAVSGLHVGLLVVVLDKLYKLLFKRENSYLMIVPILLVYTVITSFSPSITRASLMYILYVINKQAKLELSSLDILSITYLILLYIRPFYYFNMGFSLSFLVTLFILLGNGLLSHKSTLMQLFLITVLAMAATLPLITSLNKEINFMTLLVNIIFIYYMTYLILPFSYFTFFVYLLDEIYMKVIIPFEFLITLFAKIQFLTIDIVFVSHIQVVIYFVILLKILGNMHNRKMVIQYSGVLVLFLIISIHIGYLSPVKSINMIDVYGDSILIQDSFNRCNILIDTGYIDSSDKVINYIKGKAVFRLDYLIITHQHDDHNGEVMDILNDFNVEEVINTSNEKNYDDILCGSLKLHVYHFSEYTDENNKSIVFSLWMEDVHYLFTGDMESSKEREFIENYQIDVDYLKSGHHGSITSSSEAFLDDIHAEQVLISCYRNNFHGHPSDIVISRYESRNMEIYRTDYLGTIEIVYFLGNEYKIFHQP